MLSFVNKNEVAYVNGIIPAGYRRNTVQTLSYYLKEINK